MKCTTPNCDNDTPVHNRSKYCTECAKQRKKAVNDKFNQRRKDNLRLAFGFVVNK